MFLPHLSTHFKETQSHKTGPARYRTKDGAFRGTSGCPVSRASTLQGQPVVFHSAGVGKGSARAGKAPSQSALVQLADWTMFSLENQQGFLFLSTKNRKSPCPHLKTFLPKLGSA